MKVTLLERKDNFIPEPSESAIEFDVTADFRPVVFVNGQTWVSSKKFNSEKEAQAYIKQKFSKTPKSGDWADYYTKLLKREKFTVDKRFADEDSTAKVMDKLDSEIKESVVIRKTLIEGQIKQAPRYYGIKKGTTNLFYDENVGSIEISNINSHGKTKKLIFYRVSPSTEDEIASVEIYCQGSGMDTSWSVFVTPPYSRDELTCTELDEKTAVDLFDQIVIDTLKRIDVSDYECFSKSLNSVLPAVAKKYGLR